MWIAHTAASHKHTGGPEAEQINKTNTHTLLSENVYEGRSGKDVGFSKRTWDRGASKSSQYCNKSNYTHFI